MEYIKQVILGKCVALLRNHYNIAENSIYHHNEMVSLLVDKYLLTSSPAGHLDLCLKVMIGVLKVMFLLLSCVSSRKSGGDATIARE